MLLVWGHYEENICKDAHTGFHVNVSLEYLPRNRIAGLYGKCKLNIYTMPKSFPKSLNHFLSFPAMYRSSSCPISFLTLDIVRLVWMFFFFLLNRYIVVLPTMECHV